MPLNLSVGMQIGQYRLVDEIGRGGMATVWRAYQPSLDRYVAFKVLHERADPHLQERFRREARAVAQLHHPNIVQIYDLGEQDDLLYIVMELVEGPSLRQQLGQPWSSQRVARVISQLGSALDFAHQRGIVHRDVKPGNVLTERDRALLADFGIARMLNSSSGLTRVDSSIGTPDYMSPEQAAAEPVGPPSDIYSLGVMAYEMLTGQLPFVADSPLVLLNAHINKPPPRATEVNPTVGDQVANVLDRALAKRPEDRYPTGTAFAQALEQAMRAEPYDDLPTGLYRPGERRTGDGPASERPSSPSGNVAPSPRPSFDPVPEFRPPSHDPSILERPTGASGERRPPMDLGSPTGASGERGRQVADLERPTNVSGERIVAPPGAEHEARAVPPAARQPSGDPAAVGTATSHQGTLADAQRTGVYRRDAAGAAAAPSAPARPTRWGVYLGVAAVVLLLAAGALGLARFQNGSHAASGPSAATPAGGLQPTSATASTAAPSATTAPTEVPSATPEPTATAAPTATPSAAQAWAALAPQLDALWEKDWPAAIGLLDSFLKQFPEYPPAKDKQTAALLAYSKQLADAGDKAAAATQLARLQALLGPGGQGGGGLPPAAAELIAALTPTTVPTPAPPPPSYAPPPSYVPPPPSPPRVANPPAPPPPPPAPPQPRPRFTPTF